MPAKMARSAPSAAVRGARITAAVRAARRSCQNAATAQKSTPVWGSSGESRLPCRSNLYQPVFVLPCCLSITSTRSGLRKSTRSFRFFLPAPAFSTWGQGRANRRWNSSAAALGRSDRDRRLKLCHEPRFPRYGLRRPNDPAGRCQYRRRFLVKCAGARAGSVPYAWRNTPRAAPGGICLHALPTHTWRLWTTLGSYLEAISFSVSSLPRLLPQAAPNVAERQRLRQAWYRTARHTIGLCLPRRHGERGNVVSELWLFHPRWWRRNFRDNGFSVVGDEPMGLFYTGEMLLGLHLGLAKRERLALVLGSSCHLFRLVPLPRPST